MSYSFDRASGWRREILLDTASPSSKNPQFYAICLKEGGQNGEVCVHAMEQREEGLITSN